MNTVTETSTGNGIETKRPNKRAFASLGYTREESKQIVDAMNKLLSNYSVHYQKLRNYHWNVKGQDFFDIHEQFEDQYNAAKEAIDEIAERIRVFGHTPMSTMAEYLETSTIKETGTDIKAMDMVREILRDYQVLIEFMYEVIDIAIESGDMGTEDMVKGFVYETEKNHWMMSSFATIEE